ncbi:hypothetical protein Leryth_005011 [Lithospermum erythrorhizon]|nr:hypothetical protein Leryth_005011 [Lithospermum erythrorhizon]
MNNKNKNNVCLIQIIKVCNNKNFRFFIHKIMDNTNKNYVCLIEINKGIYVITIFFRFLIK